ncbi:MAG: hypothetical protein HPY50_00330 [Firmicutes bacterium]|nr:hypothetical protein [Bacillota bacterium]
MWKVSKGLSLAVIAVPLVVGIGMIAAGFMASPEALTDDGYSLKNFYYMAGVSSIVFPIIGLAGVLMYYKRINDREEHLIQNGIQGIAEILSRQQTGVYINELPQVKFLLLITLPGREPYQVVHKDVVSMLDLGSINVGARLPVFVDPNNEKNIFLNP